MLVYSLNYEKMELKTNNTKINFHHFNKKQIKKTVNQNFLVLYFFYFNANAMLVAVVNDIKKCSCLRLLVSCIILNAL